MCRQTLDIDDVMPNDEAHRTVDVQKMSRSGEAVYEDQYTIVEDVAAPAGAYGEHSHVVDFQTQQLLSQLWTACLASIRAELPPSKVGQVVRRVTYQLD